MRKLAVFNQVTLDGYFAATNGDMDWAHKHDAEWNAFVAENAAADGPMLFGRITYEMMVAYWPTPLALRNDRGLAERMNGRPKVVFSRTLREARWNNTRLVAGDIAGEIRRMKAGPGGDMVILGSGSIAQLAPAGVIDSTGSSYRSFSAKGVRCSTASRRDCPCNSRGREPSATAMSCFAMRRRLEERSMREWFA